ncbi:MAG TPA: glycogen debranching N-terminal domain-containing protein, partial [Dermatophilaceae bacterium]
MTGVIAPTEEARFGDFTTDGRAYSRMTHRQDGDAVVPLSETERNEQAQLYAMATPNYEEQTVTDLTPQEASAVRAAWLDAPTHNWDNMFHV